ncbi:PilZ domain-containing protein [Arenibaculum pallidiluteum]|uniref:PilZ domain-containing protein n=1 Tax=Arenibaculum pallidiluteum TaxID=2812559 RepID=UPI001A978090|nr:PilZ domain-containing protein [Arenibaculum pallidiluteum]
MTGFYDKRRAFREALEDATVSIDGRLYPLLNWSRGGFLLGAWTVPASPGDPVAARLRLTLRGRVREIPVAGTVVRVDAGARQLAIQFRDMPAELRTLLDEHFDPTIALRIASASVAYGEAAIVPDHAAEPSPAAHGAMPADFEAVLEEVVRSAPQESPVEAELFDASAERIAGAMACLKAMRVAVARRLHPDVKIDDGSVELRTRLLVELWQVIDEMERTVQDRGASGGGVEPRKLR